MRETISILGLVHAIFGILLFAVKKPAHLSFRILMLWFSIIAIFLGASLLPFEVVDYFKPGIFPLLFTFGPLLFLYVSSLVIDHFKLRINHLLHLVPYVLVCIHRATINAVSVTSSSNLVENPSFIFNKVYYVLVTISLFIYWILSIKIILEHRKSIPFYFSNYSKGNTLNWLIFVVLVFLVLILTDIVTSSLTKGFGIEISNFLSLSTNLTIFTFIMVFFAINQHVLFISESLTIKRNTDKKYIKSALDDQQLKSIEKTVFEYLKKQKPFLNPDFNLQMMAESLNISRHNISQVINQSQNKNFFQLINEFRIEEVKERLLNPEYTKYNILGIAFESGFNSKSAFNRIFKQETGMTPTEFRRKSA